MSYFTRTLKTLNTISVSRRGILHNFDHFQKEFPTTHLFPVLKSNAYGHGIKAIATILKDRTFPYIAVDSYYEALQVRKYSTVPILLIGYTIPENIPMMDLATISITIYDISLLDILITMKKPVRVHIKINTGMNRQGIPPADLPIFLEKILRAPHITLEGILSHFSESDLEDTSHTCHQENIFKQCLDMVENIMPLPRYIHLSATNGAFSITDKRINALRLGIGLYGYHNLSPQDPRTAWYKELKPALEVTSTVINRLSIKKGDHVSYAGTFIASRDMEIAVIPFGYYEGLTRKHSNTASVLWQGHLLPVIGNICMNITCIDTKGLPIQVGDPITVVSTESESPCVINALSKLTGTIDHETLVKFSESIRRVVVA